MYSVSKLKVIVLLSDVSDTGTLVFFLESSVSNPSAIRVLFTVIVLPPAAVTLFIAAIDGVTKAVVIITALIAAALSLPIKFVLTMNNHPFT